MSTKIWAFTLCSPGTQTEACEIFNTGRWSRLLRQEFQAQESWRVVTSWVFLVVQGFEHHELRRATRESSTRGSVSEQTRTCATAPKARVPAGQSASYNPTFFCLFSQAAGASRSSSRGRGVGLVFLWGALSFSSLFCRFSVLVSLEFSRSRGCAVATSAIRGVSRGG